LSVKQATDLAIEHLLNRTRSRKSRLKKQRLAKELVAYHGLAQCDIGKLTKAA
jgi:ribosomal protein S7